MTCKKDTKNSDTLLRRLQNAEFHGVGSDVKVIRANVIEMERAWSINQSVSPSFVQKYKTLDRTPNDDTTSTYSCPSKQCIKNIK